MLSDIFLEEAIYETDCFVRIDFSETASLGEYFLLKEVELVTVGRVFSTVRETWLKHEVSLDDPSESISHFNRNKSGHIFTLDQQLETFCVSLLLLIKHQFKRVKVCFGDATDENIDLLAW